ncbi:MAG TPA: hypothetical protein PKY05_06785 [Fibrobacteria bacterium]|nr:hypothetical protein [Fibrobacteria bacterium]
MTPEQTISELELELADSRAKNTELRQSLHAMANLGDKALMEVARLKRQRLVLTWWMHKSQRESILDRRDLEALATEVKRLHQELSLHQTAILRLGEERDHLRAELVTEKGVAMVTTVSMKRDLDDQRETALRLSLLLKRVRTRRRVVR